MSSPFHRELQPDDVEPSAPSQTLGDALPREMARIRDVVIPAYESIGPTSIFAVTMMRRDLDAAAKAMMEGDTVEMIRLLQELRDYAL